MSPFSRNEVCGFTLIEALVALLVLSLGMLGVVSMQLKSLQGAHSAYQRSVASLAAQDAQEILWKNLSQDEDGFICPDVEVVNDDASSSWNTRWSRHLPGLTTEPVTSLAYMCGYEISFSWSEPRMAGEDDSYVFIYELKLPGRE